MAADFRLVQLARILGHPRDELTEAQARQDLASRAPEVGHAFFLEAAASDDVTSVDGALDYLESRLTVFRDLLTDATADAIRAAFSDSLQSWRT